MILNSYNLKKSIDLNKWKNTYKNILTIVPSNDIYTLQTTTKKIESEVKEIKNQSKKKKEKKTRK